MLSAAKNTPFALKLSMAWLNILGMLRQSGNVLGKFRQSGIFAIAMATDFGSFTSGIFGRRFGIFWRRETKAPFPSFFFAGGASGLASSLGGSGGGGVGVADTKVAAFPDLLTRRTTSSGSTFPTTVAFFSLKFTA